LPTPPVATSSSYVIGTVSDFYDYDALDRRVSKTIGGTAINTGGTTTCYLLDGVNEIAELNSSGTLLRLYIYGSGADDRIVVAEGSSTISRWDNR